jgi:hypothetical protein
VQTIGLNRPEKEVSPVAIADTVAPDFATRFRLGVWRALISSALVEWAPGQTTDLYGSGFDGTEIEFLDGPPAEEIDAFLLDGIGDLYCLARCLGDRAPTPADLGADYVWSRQRAGGGLWDAGLGPEGDRLHELARGQGDIELLVSGREDDSAEWSVDVLV